MENLLFELVTPDGVILREMVYEIIAPTASGYIGILPNHTPLVSLATAGVITIRRHKSDPESKVEHLATGGGIVEVSGVRVRFLADTAERAEAIDELRAKEALERARELQKTAEDHVSLTDAMRLIERNLARLKVADLRRRHKQQQQ